MKRFGAGASLFMCIVGVAAAIGGINSNTPAAIAIGGVIAVVFFPIRRKLKKDLSGETARVAEVGKEQFKAEKKEAKKEKRAAAREAAIADQTLDYVLIAGQESRTSGSSAIARGAVGHAVLGPVGLLAAAGAKKKTDVTLVLHYKSGRTETKTVKLNSSEFKKLAPYMK
jgi:hypothetical protein